jgi:hypothetical protein
MPPLASRSLAEPSPNAALPATPPLASRSLAEPSAPPGGDTAAGGLARRVRGAQLPTTEPVRMRRAPEQSTSRPAAPTPPQRSPEQRRNADEVYNFLNSFTAGVQRGLDESGPNRSDGPR